MQVKITSARRFIEDKIVFYIIETFKKVQITFILIVFLP